MISQCRVGLDSRTLSHVAAHHEPAGLFRAGPFMDRIAHEVCTPIE